MVNEEIDEDNDYMGGLAVKNELRFEALLEKKKERRAVNLFENIYTIHFFRESHYLNS